MPRWQRNKGVSWPCSRRNPKIRLPGRALRLRKHRSAAAAVCTNDIVLVYRWRGASNFPATWESKRLFPFSKLWKSAVLHRWSRAVESERLSSPPAWLYESCCEAGRGGGGGGACVEDAFLDKGGSVTIPARRGAWAIRFHLSRLHLNRPELPEGAPLAPIPQLWYTVFPCLVLTLRTVLGESSSEYRNTRPLARRQYRSSPVRHPGWS